MSALVIPFVRPPRVGDSHEAPAPFRSPARADDLVMDHADTAPCEYPSWCDAPHPDHEPA